MLFVEFDSFWVWLGVLLINCFYILIGFVWLFSVVVINFKGFKEWVICNRDISFFV